MRNITPIGARASEGFGRLSDSRPSHIPGASAPRRPPPRAEQPRSGRRALSHVKARGGSAASPCLPAMSESEEARMVRSGRNSSAGTHSPFAVGRRRRGGLRADPRGERHARDGESVAGRGRLSEYSEERPELRRLQSLPAAVGVQDSRRRRFAERLVQDLGPQGRLNITAAERAAFATRPVATASREAIFSPCFDALRISPGRSVRESRPTGISPCEC